MLKWLRWVVFRPQADAERVRQDVECCLFAEVDVARVTPSRKLRRRTLAALREESLRPAPAPRRSLTLLGTYATAGGLLALVAVVASLDLGQPAPPVSPSVDAPRARPVAIVIGFDPSRYDGLKQKILQRLETSLEAQLVAEARQIFDDARAAGEIVLARLPLPAVRVERTPTSVSAP